MAPLEVLPAGTHARLNKKKKRTWAKATSDYLDFSQAMAVGRSLLWGDRPVIGFYIIFSINTGLRVSDVLQLRHRDLIKLKPTDVLRIVEIKTKKQRDISINENIYQAYLELQKRLLERGGYAIDAPIFLSQKNTVFATVSLNRILKTVFAGHARNVSTHSLRKTFGRRVYEMNKQSEHSLVLLSDIFRHSSMSITRRYLGLRSEEIRDAYLNL
jgi:integrase